MPYFDSTLFRPMVTNKTQKTKNAMVLSDDSPMAKLLDLHNLRV